MFKTRNYPVLMYSTLSGSNVVAGMCEDLYHDKLCGYPLLKSGADFSREYK